nr:MAG: DNA pilot protein [Microvirus sp.]
MDPMITSTLISAGSNILGGLFGGKSKKGPSLEDQYGAAAVASQNQARLMPSHQVAGWKAAGIHPLAGLGLSTPAAPAFGQVGGNDGPDWGSRLSEMGQGVSRAAAAFASREEREMAKASGVLQLENQQLQNDRLRSEIALMHSAGTPGLSSTLGSNGDARYSTQRELPIGFGDQGPMWRHMVNEFGEKSRVLNEDVIGDSEVLQALSSVVTLGDMLGNYMTSARSPGGKLSSWLAKRRKYIKKGGQ